jgi:hypothetical protein
MRSLLAERLGPALVNVKLSPSAGRKPQEFGWLTT